MKRSRRRTPTLSRVVKHESSAVFEPINFFGAGPAANPGQKPALGIAINNHRFAINAEHADALVKQLLEGIEGLKLATKLFEEGQGGEE